MRNTLQDIRYAWRQLRHSPGFTVVAVLTLALGIGAATALFGILNAISEATQLTASVKDLYTTVKTTAKPQSYPYRWMRISELRALEAHPPAGAAAITAEGLGYRTIAQGPRLAERLETLLIPGSFGSFFSISPQHGRWIAADDDRLGANRVAVISDRLWSTWFNRRPEAIGTSIRINLKPFSIIGVAPAVIRLPGDVSGGADLWLPLSNMAMITGQEALGLDSYDPIAILIRPRPGATAEQLGADARAVLPASTVPVGPKATPEPATVGVVSMRSLGPGFPAYGGVRSSGPWWLATSLTSLILLAACANLANLVYARGLQRTGEVAVRASLGAGTARLLRLFVAETAIIAVAASTLGLAIAIGAMALFGRAVPAFGTNAFARLSVDFSPDLDVFLYAFGAGTLAALVVGVTTAWRVSRVPPLRVLAGSGAGSGLTVRGGRTRTALVAIQITTAVCIVMTASVTVEHYQQDRDKNGRGSTPLYDASRLASASVDFQLVKFNEAQGRAFYDELLVRARALPGVESAALTASLWAGGLTNVEPEPPATGRVGSPTLARLYTSRVSPGYLQTLGLRLIRGRDFTTFDTNDAPKVALVSESGVEHLFPHGEDPIGQRVKMGPYATVTVVGVTADMVTSTDRGPTRPSNTMFIPLAQWYQDGGVIVVRSASPDGILEPLRQAVNAINPDVVVFDARTADDYFRSNDSVRRAFDALIASLGAVALGIAMLGVYGVVAYFVSTRRREFGIRLALGATPGRVVKLVVDHAIHIVLIGLLPGVFLVSIGSRLTQSRFNQFTPMAIPTWFIVPALILLAGIVAGYVPARRAARVDPNVALREL